MAGFYHERTRGSHHVMVRDEPEKTVVVPVHGNKSLGTGLLRAIIRESGLTRDEFVKLLDGEELGDSKAE